MKKQISPPKKHRLIKHEKSIYPVIVQEDELGGYWVSCPTFEGCYSQGESIEEALSGIREAIELCKEDEQKVAISGLVSLHLVQV